MPLLPEVRKFVSSSGVRVYRIPCKVFAELTARVYLVLGAGPATLVDTGSGQGASTKNMLDGFDTVRREFDEAICVEDVRRIILTHAHLDHYGGLPDLLRLTAAEVWVHPLDRRLLTNHAEYAALVRANVRRLLAHAGVPADVTGEFLAQHWRSAGGVPELPRPIEPLDGQWIDGLRVIHTPGHSPGHVCLVADDLLLCGDHILPRTIPQLWPESLRPYKGLGHYLESLDAVRRVPGLKVGLPGHEPVIEDVYRRIDEIERSEYRRMERVVDVVASAPRALTIWQITKTIYAQTTGFFALLAFMDTAARVEHLHQRGQLRLANLQRVEAQPETAWEYLASG